MKHGLPALMHAADTTATPDGRQVTVVAGDRYLWPIQRLTDDFAFDIRRNLDLFCVSFTVTRKNLM